MFVRDLLETKEPVYNLLYLNTRIVIINSGLTSQIGFEVHAFGWTGQENIMPTCRSAGN